MCVYVCMYVCMYVWISQGNARKTIEYISKITKNWYSKIGRAIIEIIEVNISI